MRGLEDVTMSILRKALKMLEKHPLCDHCLGRQFALLGHGIGNDKRGVTIKLALTLKAHASAFSKELNHEGVALLKTIARNGFSKTAEETLRARPQLPPDDLEEDGEDVAEGEGALPPPRGVRGPAGHPRG